MKRHATTRAQDAACRSRRRRAGGVVALRSSMERLLPIALLALLLQVLAPVGASWMAAAAMADPLGRAEICHTDAGSPAPDHGRDRDACKLDCLLCCVLHAGGTLDVPRAAAAAAPRRQTMSVAWREADLGLVLRKSGSVAWARGPPIPFLI